MWSLPDSNTFWTVNKYVNRKKLKLSNCQNFRNCQKSPPKMDFHQFTRTVQKIVLYETKSVSFQSKIILDEFDHWIFQRLYIVGSNHAQTKFRIIKVDRTEPRDLLISDDKVIYDPIQIREVLNMIDVGKTRQTSFWRTFYTKMKNGKKFRQIAGIHS